MNIYAHIYIICFQYFVRTYYGPVAILSAGSSRKKIKMLILLKDLLTLGFLFIKFENYRGKIASEDKKSVKNK